MITFLIIIYAIPVLLGIVCIAKAIVGCIEYELFEVGDNV